MEQLLGCLIKKDLFLFQKAELDADEFMMAALEAGAEDVLEEEETFEVYTDYAEFQTVLENLKSAGFEYAEAEISMFPENKVEIKDLETAKKVKKL